jgi:RNA polymerase sigma-70 factor, ECF subfamily
VRHVDHTLQKLAIKIDLKKSLVPISAEQLFRQYFETYFEALFIYAFTMVKDTAEAKDIAQLSFIKLWDKRNDVELERSAKAYLFTTVYHLCLNAIRNKKLHTRHHQNLKMNQPAATQFTAEQNEVIRQVMYSIDQLPARCKEIFIKNRFEAKKYAEIAEELNISEKTVEAQMSKALKHLKEQLKNITLVLTLLLLMG